MHSWQAAVAHFAAAQCAAIRQRRTQGTRPAARGLPSHAARDALRHWQGRGHSLPPHPCPPPPYHPPACAPPPCPRPFSLCPAPHLRPPARPPPCPPSFLRPQWDLVPTAANTLNVQPLQELRGVQGGITCLAMSPDGVTMATGNSDHTLRVWSTRSNQQLMVLQVTNRYTCVSPVTCLMHTYLPTCRIYIYTVNPNDNLMTT